MGRVIHQTEALSVVIRTILENFQKNFSVERKTGLKFFYFNFEQKSERAG